MFTILTNFLFSLLDLFPTYDLSPLISRLANILGTCKFLVGTFTFGLLAFVVTVWVFHSLIKFILRVAFKGALKIIDILT